MNKTLSQFIFATALLLATGAVSLSGITTAQAQVPVAPSIELAVDTGIKDDDRITSNGQVDVTLEGDFDSAGGDTWEYSTNGGTDFTTGTGTFFTLEEGEYAATDVQVVQTLLGVDSAAARLAAVTVDSTAPVITVTRAPATPINPTVTGQTSVTVAENVTEPVADYMAAAATGRYILGWHLGGADAVAFQISLNPDQTHINVVFRTPPNYEAPIDVRGDNTYHITLIAADKELFHTGEGYDPDLSLSSEPYAITITVTDADDPGSVTITGTAQVGRTLTAGTVTDDDGGVTGTGRKWQSAASGGDYDDISGAIGLTYTPVEGDIGKPIQVVATYTDDFDGNTKTAISTPTTAVLPTEPVTVTGQTSVTVAENTTEPVADYRGVAATGRYILGWHLGGADAVAFQISLNPDQTHINVVFRTPPNYEAPTDVGGDNTYHITLIAQDKALFGSGYDLDMSLFSEPYAITITVTDGDDAGAIGVIIGTAQVGEQLTAGDVTDPDGGVTDITWQWQNAADDSNIAGATNAVMYTLTPTDSGKTIQVVATYTDSFGAKSITSRATVAVVAADAPAPVRDVVLAVDTGSDTSDGITNNGQVEVTLASDFDSARGDTWKYSIKGVTTTITDSTVTFFTLDEGEYAATDVQVVQTLLGVDSAAVSLGAVTLDSTAPTVENFDDAISDSRIGTEHWRAILFTEVVTGLEVGAFSASTGITPGRVIPTFGPTILEHYSFFFTPKAAAFTLTLAANSVMDLAGNPGPASALSVSATAAAPDTTPPTVHWGTLATGVIGTPQTHDFSFSEVVSSVTEDDFSTSGVQLDYVIGRNAGYTIGFTPTAATFTLTLAANSVRDTAIPLNWGPATAQPVTGTAILDSSAPTVQSLVIDAPDNLVIDETQTVVLTFTEVVTGLEVSDFTTTGATVNSLSGAGDRYTITFTPIAAAFILTLAANSVEDGGGNASPATARRVTGTATIGPTFISSTASHNGAVRVGGINYLNVGDTLSVRVAVNRVLAATSLVGAAQFGFDGSDDPAAQDLLLRSTDRVACALSVCQYGATYTVRAGDTGLPRFKVIGVTSTDDEPLEELVDQLEFYWVDTTAPTVNFGTLAPGIIGTPQTHSTIFDEAVTDFATADLSASGARVNRVISTGDHTLYYIVLTPTAATFTLTLAVNSVTDAAGNPGPASRTGTATAPVATNVDLSGLTISARATGTPTLRGTDSADAPIAIVGTDDTSNVADTVPRTLTLVAADAPATPSIALTEDNTAPEITAPIAMTFEARAAMTPLTANEHYGTATSTDGTAKITDDAPVTFPRGPTTITWTATDVAGNAGTATQVVTVQDTTAPEITLLGASAVEVDQGSTFTDPGATVSDGVDAELSASIVVGGDPVDTDTAGDYTLSYDVSDAAGNAAETVTRIVRVVIVRDLARLNAVILPEVARSMADQHVSGIVRRLEQARLSSLRSAGSAGSGSFGGAGSLTELIKTQGRALADDQFDLKRVLAGSAFVLPLNGAGGSDSGSESQGLTFWGAGDYRDLGATDRVSWDGNLFSLHLGLDARLNERTILGVSVSKSQARLDYTDSRLATSGDYDLDMTSVHPYLGWAVGGLDFWATLGYGDGELEISEDGAPGEALPSSDLSVQTFALGASGSLMETGRTSLGLKGEALRSSVELDGNAQIAAVTRDASRLRLALEASRTQSLDSGAQFESSLEAGLRYDGGDGETGAGAEVGASLRYASRGGSLVIEGKARALVGGKGEAEEWGLSGRVKFAPSADGRGLSFSLTPGYGVTNSGVQQLWQQGLIDEGRAGASHGAAKEYSPSLEVRLDYGMHAPRGPGLMTPYTELSLGDKSTYRLGLQWQRSKMFELKLVTERKESNTTDDHRIYLEGEVAF